MFRDNYLKNINMSKKNLYLGGLLIILIAAAYFYNGPWQKIQADKGKVKNFLSKISVDDINFIDITSNGKKTVLEKMGDKWKISGTKDFYAEDSVASALLGGLKDAQKADMELASENKDKKDSFEVSEEKGTIVKLRKGDSALSELIIGKASANNTSSYISLIGDDKTYLVKAPLSGLVMRDDWYDKKIFTADQSRINKIRFQYPNREFTIEKKDDVWSGISPNKFTVNADKITEILTLMSGLTAVKIPEQNFAGTGLEKSGVIVQATGDGIDNTIMIGNAFKGEDGDKQEYYYAKKGTSDNIYLLTKANRDALNKTSKDLK